MGGSPHTQRGHAPALFRADGVVLAGLIALALWLTGFVGDGFATPIQHDRGEDWDWQLTMVAAGARSILEFGQPPTWNPYTAGGVPLLANPEFPGAHPAYALVLALGPERGVKAMILVHLVLGWAGLTLLARQLGVRRPFDLLPALLLAGCSVWSYRLVWGHLMVQSFAYLPWAWWLLLRARGRPAFGAGAGLALGLALLAGGHQVFLVGVVTAGLWLGLDTAAAPRRPLGSLVAMLGVAGLFAAARALPMWAAGAEAERLGLAVDATAIGRYDLAGLLRVWAGAAPLQGEHESQPTFHGWLPLLLAAGGAVVALRKRRALLLVWLTALALSLADNLPLDPFALLRSVPGLSGYRYPERFALAHAPLLALLAAIGAQGVWTLARRRTWTAAAVGGVLLLASGAHLVTALPAERTRFGYLRGHAPSPAAVDAQRVPFQQDPGADWNYRALRAHRGCPGCRDALGLPPPGRPWGSPLAEADAGADVEVLRFAGSSIALRIRAPRRSAVTVRQAARAGWTARLDGLPHPVPQGPRWLRVEVPAGEHVVLLRYVPPGALPASLCLLAALLLVGVLVRGDLRGWARGRD